MTTFGKGGQRVEVAPTDSTLIAYYAGEGWAEVTDATSEAPVTEPPAPVAVPTPVEAVPVAPAGDVPAPSPAVPPSPGPLPQ